jgi:hypothetical protein
MGPDAIVEWSRAFSNGVPDMSWDHSTSLTLETRHSTRASWSERTAAPSSRRTGQIPATGKRLRLRMADAVTVESGLVTSHRFYFDRLELLGQLGLAPER